MWLCVVLECIPVPPVMIAHPHKTKNMLVRSYRCQAASAIAEAMPHSIIKTKLLKTKLDMLYNYDHRTDTPAAAPSLLCLSWCASLILCHSLHSVSISLTESNFVFFIPFSSFFMSTFMNQSECVFVCVYFLPASLYFFFVFAVFVCQFLVFVYFCSIQFNLLFITFRFFSHCICCWCERIGGKKAAHHAQV